jgi:DNA-binding response OmpR family regulator
MDEETRCEGATTRGRAIVIADDDPDVAALVQDALEDEHFRCSVVSSGTSVLSRARRDPPDLVILDVNLPDIDGFTVLTHLRRDASTAELPVLILTGRTEARDRIVGLELGGDDYLTKPFNVRELTLRVHALLRRSRFRALDAQRTIGQLVIDPARHLVSVAGEPVELAPKAYAVLRVLIDARGHVVDRPTMLRDVWGGHDVGDVHPRSLDVHIATLRKALGPEGARIVTVKGVGYRLKL